MSESILKQSNTILQSLLDEYKSDPVTDEDGVQKIIDSVERLKKSRDKMEYEYEQEKSRGEELQKKLGATLNDFQKCSTSEVPVLKQKLGDLQIQFDAIIKEMAVTTAIVGPLQEVIQKGHNDLHKCIAREKEIVAALTSPQEIDATAAAMSKSTTASASDEDTFVDAEDKTANSIQPEDGVIHHVISDIPVELVTAAELRAMNPFTLQGYAKKNGISSSVQDLTELRNEIWSHRQSSMLGTQAEIAKWDRTTLLQAAGDLYGKFRGQPVEDVDVEVLRKTLIDERKRIDWYDVLQNKDPVLLAKLEKATNRQLVKWIKQYEPTFTLVHGVSDEHTEFILFWKAVDIAVNQPRL